MSIKRFMVLILTLSILILIVGCSKDNDNNPAGPTVNNAPAFEVKTIDAPAKMTQASESGDYGATVGIAYLHMANGMSAYGGYFSHHTSMNKLQKVSDGDVWENEWSITDSMTMKIKSTETNTKYTWELFLNGIDEGAVYNNWRMMYVEELKDGSSGFSNYYMDGSTELLLEWSWETNSEDIFHFVFIRHGDNGEVIDITSNPDGSGEIKASSFTNSPTKLTLTYKAVWNADGSGQWWTYTNGVVTDTKEWS